MRMLVRHIIPLYIFIFYILILLDMYDAIRGMSAVGILNMPLMMISWVKIMLIIPAVLILCVAIFYIVVFVKNKFVNKIRSIRGGGSIV